ncbi:hypothetical protein [Mesorhizobium sp. B2-6-5]|uniref:hypothetical protein n=1 Tax=Mesorhizobium sp. B2-6-5 TaxID=2589912 RepID=UPI0015E31C01|nr:hypothetical protein [Mesorhizobium sp. B2-6-5]
MMRRSARAVVLLFNNLGLQISVSLHLVKDADQVLYRGLGYVVEKTRSFVNPLDF